MTTIKALINQALERPYEVPAYLIIGGVVYIMVPSLLGFGPTGPVSGSFATSRQSRTGNVARGSGFSILQSLTMRGVFNKIGVAMIYAGVLYWGASVVLRVTVSVGKFCAGLGRAAPGTMGWAKDAATQQGGEFYTGVLARAADVAAEYGGAAGLVARAADLAAEYDVNFYTTRAADKIARAGEIAAKYGAAGSREAAGVRSWAANVAAQYGWA